MFRSGWANARRRRGASGIRHWRLSLTFKDMARETHILRARFSIATALVLMLAGLLSMRLIQLQVLNHDHFRTLSEKNRVKIVPVPPTRGLIYDRHGVVLARNRPYHSLEIVPETVPDLEATIEALRDIVTVSRRDEEQFRMRLRQERRFQSVPLRFQLSEQEVARFAVNRHRFPGVDVRARLTREYPLGTRAAHAIGYVARISASDLQHVHRAKYRGTDYIGKIGVEQTYEQVLHGEVGFQHVEINAQGRILRVLKRSPPIPGNDVHLSLDASLQAVAEAALGEENGAVVAIEPATGDVLALASMPSFDPNLFVTGMDADVYGRLRTSSDRPLFNRALHGQYPPGSTIKPFLALAALETHRAGLAHNKIWCPGWYQIKGRSHRYRDWKREGHGRVGLERAIVESCDVYFYQLALELGIERMHDFMATFGFGRRTGIDLPSEAEGLMPSVEWKRHRRNEPWFPGETVITGIGQGFTLTTPLQLSSAIATLGMRGLRVQPRLVNGITDAVTGTSRRPSPVWLGKVGIASTRHWNRVIGALVQVVHGARGTARRIGVGAPYRMAGKTGTAQVFGIEQDEEYDEEEVEKRLRDHGLFVAFAPPDEPRIAISVVVENGGSGSRAAAPIARKVMDHYLAQRAKLPVSDDVVVSAHHQSDGGRADR